MNEALTKTAEFARLEEARLGQVAWKRWGPYLAERAWGTVREDYSADGDAWTSFPHDHARSRAYRWNEDGLLGVSDDHGRLCLALSVWNGNDPILKERLFGLTNTQGNHGEDVKEYTHFLDATPTHSYLRAVYSYPQAAFPYQDLIDESARRTRDEPEYELIDTGIFGEQRYWDIEVEYAKAGPGDLLMRVTAHNRGSEPAALHLLPTLWFRNTWSWGDVVTKPVVEVMAPGLIRATHADLTLSWLAHEAGEALLCENETNFARLYGGQNVSDTAKDGINEAVVHGAASAVRRDHGTKAAVHARLTAQPGSSVQMRLRLRDAPLSEPFKDFDTVFDARIRDADEFYAAVVPAETSADARLVTRQALAGLLWNKQFYHYDLQRWLDGDPAGPPPPPERRQGRNHNWLTLHNADVLSMPDGWEYPWYASWDLAFHTVPLSLIDPQFAKNQLELLTREWYQHPNGQLPAYEWAFGDVNPPVQAWATWQVYQTEQRRFGRSDRSFLEGMFHKLLLNFTWWVNRKDEDGRNVFQGGFLGLDNISVFDRSAPLPGGGRLEQADGTAWMGMYCLNMLKIALELARENMIYEDIATKFFEHFLYIARALNAVGDKMGEDGNSLWDETDEFYYDQIRMLDGTCTRLRVRSMVGLMPLLATETLTPQDLSQFPGFKSRLDWFLTHRPDLASLVSRWNEPGAGELHLLALARGHRLKRVLARVLDEAEFLSPHGVRSLSRAHQQTPFELHLDGATFRADYQPGESNSALFGGNSNWRGPIWLPLNALLIDRLRTAYRYYGDDFLIECPARSGTQRTLDGVADFLSERLATLFLRDHNGNRAVFGDEMRFQQGEFWRDRVPFHEYFHGETGKGLGASHQTGWTALIASLLCRQL